MQERTFWFSWAQFLQHWGLRRPAALLLDAFGPLGLIFAQMLYIGKPLLGGMLPQGQWDALAGMLEDRQESCKFIAYLREEV
jgi:hypothetical protein